MKKRRVLAVLAGVILLPLLALVALVLIAQSEWGEHWVEQRLANHLQREVDIGGLSVKLGWPPRIILGKLRIGNPKWAQTPDLIDAEGFHARVAVLPLFRGQIVVPYLGARRATAGLELDGERATWRFGDATEKESRLHLGLIYLDEGRIKYIDRSEGTELDIDAKGSAGEGGQLRAVGKGRFRNEATQAEVRIPNLNPQHEAPLAIEGKGNVGRTRVAADGTLATDGRTLDLKLRLEGQTFKDLAKITGMTLPDTPPYRLAGHLVHTGNEWVFDPFEGKVGDSDLAGSLTYVKGGKRPFLKANLRSKLLDFDDLGPLIGAPPKTGAGETASPEQRARAARREAAQRLLPDQHFEVDSWKNMDADVRLEALRVQRPKQLPIDKLSTHLVLEDSVLKLEPLHFGIAEGRVTSNITLNAQARPVRGDMKVDVQGVKLAPLFPTVKTMQEALGTLYGRADLAGTGTSVAELLGTSDGKASLAVDGGRIGALLVELIGLDVAESLMMLGRKHAQVQLRCAVSGFEVKDGVAKSDRFVVDTDDTVIKVDGSVSLRDETFDLETRAYPKDMSPLALRTPLTLKGPMRNPRIRPKPGPLVARAAAAAALGAVAPPLAALALIETGPGKDANCGELLAEAKAKGAVKKTS